MKLNSIFIMFILKLPNCNRIFIKFIIKLRNCNWIKLQSRVLENHALREILIVVLTKRSQLFIFSKQYQKCCEIYQCSKVYRTKYATSFVKFIKFIKFKKRNYFTFICNISCNHKSLIIVKLFRRIRYFLLINIHIHWLLEILLLFFIKMRRIKSW